MKELKVKIEKLGDNFDSESANELLGYKKAILDVLKTIEREKNKNDKLRLLRETAMRCQIAFPQNQEDLDWFNDGLSPKKPCDFMDRLFDTIDCGKI